MENQSTVVDVLLYQDDPISRSLQRVLQKYPDITLFTKETIGDIIPDIIIFTENDPYRCVEALRGIPDSYQDSRPVYVRDYFDSVTLGLMQYMEVMDLISTSLNSKEIHDLLKTIGSSPVGGLSKKKVTRFYNRYYGDLQQYGLTFKQSMILGAHVRGYTWRKISAMLGINQKRFRLERNLARKKVGLSTVDSRKLPAIFMYGGISVGAKFKKYNIPRMRHKPGYYLIPHFKEGESEE